jgi:hypothetical protein
MAEVVRVEEGVTAMTFADKHTIGIKKVSRTKSWKTGIEAREKKLGRIEKAVEYVRTLTDIAVSYAQARGIPFLPGIQGIALKYLKAKYYGYNTLATAIVNSVPNDWRGYFTEIEKYKDMFSEIRSIRV